ncbi:putative RNA recognition motif domain, nucleotide-binding alpha-beta plait domain superfamily [Helianthus annuus]|nr:putative RNA recognition motif domain, nucleotide-binding alpha-beta plait domain superfamily [Helianthus annuus]
MEQDGPWLDPHHLRKKKFHEANGKQTKEKITKFFVTNLPSGCNPWDISEFVKVFGEVAGVYIAKKKDKDGNRFGFVSFNNVRDAKELERALNGTKMGDSKLKVNIARFATENVGLLDAAETRKKDAPDLQKGGNHVNQQFRNNDFIKEGGGRLFSDLFVKGNGASGGVSSSLPKEGIMVEAHENILAFQELIGSAAVGRCSNLMILNSLFSLMTKAGVGEFSVSYLGGLYVLVKLQDEERCNSFIGNHALWENWFSSLDHWNGQSLPFERIAWLRVVGVPLHLAVDEVYDSIARHFGKIIHASERSSEDIDLSVNCIGVLRGDGDRIAEVVSLIWKDRRFKIWVEEVAEEWTPEGLENDGTESDGVKSSEDVFSLEFQDGVKVDEKVHEVSQPPDNNCVALEEEQELQKLHGEGSCHVGGGKFSVRRENVGGIQMLLLWIEVLQLELMWSHRIT